ncbi:protease Do-like 8, chloroplastic isoform X2 [Juglans microcarpa x Juglans regia]|uniref:protease Do-like 8, chloroplastic isoform X2 n=1 Tax=Juglans microcarpa x Juglans regia TaxID=2249226 RepID=UPI001B7E94C0|nr:protease Do-like 8, chloroplastic isoform X2 [Juglans microcarpa x Juglans regia]
MQVLACNSGHLQSHAISVLSRLIGRRELCFDVCSHSQPHHNDSHKNTILSQPNTIQRCHSKNLDRVMCNNVLVTTRRILVASLFMYSCYHPSRYSSALALGDPSVTVEEVTPPVYPSGSLYPVEIPEGNGSGVVWDGQGHIVTNYHVIGNSLSKNPSPGQVVARVNLLASEGVLKSFEGKLIGADRAKDLAVLKVEASEDLLRPIKVGQSSSLKVGQQCLAIGNPFGFDHTLTVGVISGLNRDIFSQVGVTIGGGVQTDAAINPGNSGGPLLDSKGNLIGVNTAIFTQTGTSAGVGFAIPSSTVSKIVPQLIQFGKVVRAGLNLDIAPDLVANQLNVRNGALVLLVPGNSLAAKAGLLPTTRGFAGNIVLGDIIVAVDNKSVKSKAELYKVWDDYNVGDKVVLKILRGSENVEIPIVLEEKNS